MADDTMPGVEPAGDEDLEPGWRWFLTHAREVNRLLDGETPRGAAVLARAYLDAVLDEYLLLLALRRPQVRRKLAAAVGGELERKIKVCGDLGDVPSRAITQMHLLRQIGNLFAHNPAVRTFDHPEALAILAQLDQATEWAHGPVPNRQSHLALWGTSILGLALQLSIVTLSPETLDEPAND